MQQDGQTRKRQRVHNRSIPRAQTNPSAQGQNLPEALIPCSLPFKGAYWNAQALLAADPILQQSKRTRVWKLIQDHDFAGVSETHGTVGSAAAFSLPPDVTPFWSHGTTHQAGIALFVRNHFLQRFNPTTPESWKELQPGRLAYLDLKGEAGALRIFVGYFDTGTTARPQREILRNSIASHAPSPHFCHSIIMADFNYVTSDDDRVQLRNGTTSGAPDASDEAHFRRVLSERHSFKELQQDAFTHELNGCRSRLDRVYSNHALSDQLDRQYVCHAHPWTPLSSHRPVSFARIHSRKDRKVASSLQAAVCMHED